MLDLGSDLKANHTLSVKSHFKCSTQQPQRNTWRTYSIWLRTQSSRYVRCIDCYILTSDLLLPPDHRLR
jgi:hypothetical protein